MAYIKNWFTSDCIGEKQCSLDLTSSNNFLSGVSPTCSNPRNRLFIQFGCEMDTQMKSDTYLILCWAVVTVLSCAVPYSLLIYYMQKTATLDTRLFDLETVTASDYTVELDLTPQMYNDYKANVWP